MDWFGLYAKMRHHFLPVDIWNKIRVENLCKWEILFPNSCGFDINMLYLKFKVFFRTVFWVFLKILKKLLFKDKKSLLYARMRIHLNIKIIDASLSTENEPLAAFARGLNFMNTYLLVKSITNYCVSEFASVFEIQGVDKLFDSVDKGFVDIGFTCIVRKHTRKYFRRVHFPCG